MISSPVGAGQTTKTISVGDKAPDFTLKDLDGRSVRLSDFRGRVVVLDFWATWCSACVFELPYLERLQGRDHGIELSVVTVNIESPEKAGAFMEEKGYSFQTLLDEDQQVMAAYGIRMIPDAIVIDPDGVVLARVVGARNRAMITRTLVEERIRQYYDGHAPEG